MKIAAILGVKDDVELIEPCIAHLGAIGVDRIIAIDAGSTDGTLEVLLERRSDEFRVYEHSDRDPDAEAYGRLLIELTHGAEADWVLFLDADEFWIPAGGSIRECKSLADADVLRVRRFNVPLGPEGLMTPGHRAPCGYADVCCIVDAIPDFRSHLERYPETPWIRGVPAPKVMARPGRVSEVTEAGHDVIPAAGTPVRRKKAPDLFVAHLPFTTLSRFERKVENVRGVFSVHAEYFGEKSAWHWRRWLALTDAESIRAEFEHQRFDAATIEAYRDSGVIKSASQLFAAWMASDAAA